MGYLIGADIGGTKCAVVLGKSDGIGINILWRECFDTKSKKNPDEAFSDMIALINKSTLNLGVHKDEISAIGISCGNPLNIQKGLILSPPNLIGWDNVPIVDMFKNHFNIPIGLENDANAGALAEWYYGAARGRDNIVFITFGTGFGAGLILNGKLYRGACNMAGEYGHMRMGEYGPVGYGKMGSLEGFCSGGGIAQLATYIALEYLQTNRKTALCHKIEDLSQITAKTTAQAAKNGDEAALRVFDIVGQRLGQGLAVIMDSLNPEMIVIGGIFTRCRDLIHFRAEEAAKKEALSKTFEVCEVVPSFLGEGIGDYAALAVAQQQIQ